MEIFGKTIQLSDMLENKLIINMCSTALPLDFFGLVLFVHCQVPWCDQ
jgi:hypothetical protein